MTRRVRATKATFMQDALAYLEERDTVAEHNRPLEKYKKSLKEYINAHGEEDEFSGDLVVEFDKPVKINGTTYTGLRQQKKPTSYFDEEKAMELVQKKKLLDAIPSHTEYDWEDGLYVLNAKKKITDEELESVQEERVQWALQVIK